MKDRTTKWLIAGIIISVIIMVIGYVLWTNLNMIQNVEDLSPQEMRNIQKEMAIHYPLGSLLLNLGFIGFSSTLLALVVKHLMTVIKKNK